MKPLLSLTAAILAWVAIVALVAWNARADELEPPGFAEAQRAAFWSAIKKAPLLDGVDQIVIEGPGNGPIMTGWLQKKNWTGDKPTVLERRFWTRIDRTCPDVTPECFRVVGIWSGSDLLSRLGE